MPFSTVTIPRFLSAPSSVDLRSVSIFVVSFVVSKLVLRYGVGQGTGSLPPGPRGWPLVGYAPYLGRYPHKVMAQLGQSYGDVYSLAIGPRTVVVINRVGAVKEAIVRHGLQTSGRTPPARAVTVISGHRVISGAPNGNLAEEFSGTSAVQASTACKQRSRAKPTSCAPKSPVDAPGASLDVCTLMNNAVANIMCSVVFGSRFGYDDAAFKRMMELSFDIQKGGFSAMENFLPCVYKLPFLFRRAKGKKREIRNFIRDMLYRGREWVDPAHARSMADLYFIEMDRQSKDNDFAGVHFKEDHIVSAAWDMFIAGVETTAVTLQWAMLYLTLYTDVQNKIQLEIDNVVGRSRPPSWSDQKDMLYTRVAIMEIQRCANIVPIALPHTVTEEFKLRGYTIPKGTMLFINLWSVMTDPDQWDQPEKFQPERFLDSDLKIVTPEAFMPFSAGPRVCMGEQLAKMELFIFITSVLQHFDLTLPQGKPRPSLDPLPGITCGPNPYQVCMSKRLGFPTNQDKLEEQ